MVALEMKLRKHPIPSGQSTDRMESSSGRTIMCVTTTYPKYSYLRHKILFDIFNVAIYIYAYDKAAYLLYHEHVQQTKQAQCTYNEIMLFIPLIRMNIVMVYYLSRFSTLLHTHSPSTVRSHYNEQDILESFCYSGDFIKPKLRHNSAKELILEFSSMYLESLLGKLNSFPITQHF